VRAEVEGCWVYCLGFYYGLLITVLSCVLGAMLKCYLDVG
jgi:hypothetical protein